MSIGSSSLYQSYYACLTKTPQNAIIEYGKTQGDANFGHNYLTVNDRSNPINTRFYTFGNGEDDVTITDIKVTTRSSLVQQCKGGTVQDSAGLFCLTKKCHKACDDRTGTVEPNFDLSIITFMMLTSSTCETGLFSQKLITL